MLELVCARYLDGYKLELRFNSGESGIVDLVDSLWGPVFEPLRDLEHFKQFHVSPILHTYPLNNWWVRLGA